MSSYDELTKNVYHESWYARLWEVLRYYALRHGVLVFFDGDK